MSSSESNNNKELISEALSTKIRLALFEAELESLDLHLISFGKGQGELSSLVIQWLKGSEYGHAGKFNIHFQDAAVFEALKAHKRKTKHLVDESIKIQEFKEILLIGPTTAIFQAQEKVFIQQGKEFVDMMNKVVRTLTKITALIEAREK